jgi:hypothetical protein
MVVFVIPVESEGRTWISHHEPLPPHFFGYSYSSGGTPSSSHDFKFTPVDVVVNTADGDNDDDDNTIPNRQRRRRTSTISSSSSRTTNVAIKEVQPVQRHMPPSSSSSSSLSPSQHKHSKKMFFEQDPYAYAAGAFGWEPELGIH